MVNIILKFTGSSSTGTRYQLSSSTRTIRILLVPVRVLNLVLEYAARPKAPGKV
eukprot:SAG31_NODE_1770_length_7309_cov_56.975867_1_plen_53_part_10